MYGVIADYSYRAVAGVYRAKSHGVVSTLLLGEDQGFAQEVVLNGKTQRSRGTWRRFGEGRVAFSKEFIRMQGEEARSDGQVDGEVEKTLGLFFTIHIDPDPGGSVYHKRLFSVLLEVNTARLYFQTRPCCICHHRSILYRILHSV